MFCFVVARADCLFEFTFMEGGFPDIWGQHTNKGAHVLSVRLEDANKVALERAIQKLNQLKQDEFTDSEDDDDSENSCMSDPY